MLTKKIYLSYNGNNFIADIPFWRCRSKTSSFVYHTREGRLYSAKEDFKEPVQIGGIFESTRRGRHFTLVGNESLQYLTAYNLIIQILTELDSNSPSINVRFVSYDDKMRAKGKGHVLIKTI